MYLGNFNSIQGRNTQDKMNKMNCCQNTVPKMTSGAVGNWPANTLSLLKLKKSFYTATGPECSADSRETSKGCNVHLFLQIQVLFPKINGNTDFKSTSQSDLEQTPSHEKDNRSNTTVPPGIYQ